MSESYEYSELFAVDLAFGKHLLSSYSNLSGEKGPAEFKEFLTRDPKTKIFRHDADSVQGFLKNLMASGKNAVTETSGKRVNYPKLPLVCYCRKPGLVSDDESTGGAFNKKRIRFTDDETTLLKVKILSVVLTYRLAFVARDKPTLDKLLLSWFAYVSDTINNRHKFKVDFLVDGVDVDAVAVIHSPKSLSFDDESVTGETGRFFAAATSVEVSAPIFWGDVVEVVDPARIQYAWEVMEGA